MLAMTKIDGKRYQSQVLQYEGLGETFLETAILRAPAVQLLYGLCHLAPCENRLPAIELHYRRRVGA
jgi:hypothetical protein